MCDELTGCGEEGGGASGQLNPPENLTLLASLFNITVERERFPEHKSCGVDYVSRSGRAVLAAGSVHHTLSFPV